MLHPGIKILLMCVMHLHSLLFFRMFICFQSMSVSDSVQYPTTEKSTHEQDFQELPDDMTSSSQQDISHSSGNAGSAELQHSLSDYASYIDSSGDFSAGASARIQRSVTVPACKLHYHENSLVLSWDGIVYFVDGNTAAGNDQCLTNQSYLDHL